MLFFVVLFAVVEAVLAAVHTHCRHVENVTVDALRGFEHPDDRIQEIPERLLPWNFQWLKWPRQVCHCLDAVMTWATENGESAAILVLAPGESEMEQIIVQWLAFNSKFKQECNVHRVDSDTPKDERSNIRCLLQNQNFRPSEKHNVVIATAVFEKSITL